MPGYIPKRQRKGKMRDFLKDIENRVKIPDPEHLRGENESEAILEEIHGQ